ncbi:MAG: hypothetical protein KGS72_20930 [Cyanobacteria bacterium REEB67]|nr:hypothetical protein [Cyanobacteria bacterium REEB67]
MRNLPAQSSYLAPALVLSILAATAAAAQTAESGSLPTNDHKTDSGAIARANANQLPASGAPGRIDSPPIHGWHPIKRALQPIESLERNGVHLEQEIGKMEAPIKDLHPPMIRLQDKASGVSDTMGKMQTQMGSVGKQMDGVRSDLGKLKKDIADIKGPIVSVREPLENIQGPLDGVLRQLHTIFLAIIAAGFCIVVGMPIFAVVVYRFRDKLFPADVAQAAEKDVENWHTV